MPEKQRTKICNTCHLEKPLSGFRRNGKYSDGRVGKCTECLLERATELNAQKVVAEQYFDPKSQPF
jgi:hypothetical protein